MLSGSHLRQGMSRNVCFGTLVVSGAQTVLIKSRQAAALSEPCERGAAKVCLDNTPLPPCPHQMLTSLRASSSSTRLKMTVLFTPCDGEQATASASWQTQHSAEFTPAWLGYSAGLLPANPQAAQATARWRQCGPRLGEAQPHALIGQGLVALQAVWQSMPPLSGQSTARGELQQQRLRNHCFCHSAGCAGSP